jgi:hypothetical protein
MHITKKQKISYFWEVRNRSFGRIWAHFGRPKVMKNRVCSQHEKHPNRMVYAANLSIEGGQEPIKMEAKKLENYRKMK